MAYDNSVSIPAHPDAPTLVTENMAESPPTLGRWTQGGTMTSTDETHPEFPVAAVYDRVLYVDSRPTHDAALWYLNLYTRSTVLGSVLMIAGHNLNGCDVRVETANNDNFSLDLVTIYDFGTVATTSRLLRIIPSTLWGLVERLRVRISIPGGGTPQISEFMFGHRYVMPRQPDVPYDDKQLFSEVDKLRSRGGVQTNYAEGGLGIRRANIRMRLNTTGDRDALRTAFTNTNYGHKPFLYFDRPNTVPGTGYWMDWEDKQLVQNAVEAQIRDVSIPLVECAPLVSQGMQ